MNDETARPAGPDWAALPGEAPPRPFPRTAVDRIAALAFYLVGYLYVRLVLDASARWETGVFTLVFATAVLAYLLATGVRPPAFSWLWLAVTACLGLSYPLFPNASLLGFDGLALHAAAMYWALCAGGRSLRGRTSYLLPADLCTAFLLAPFGNFFALVRCLFGGWKLRREGLGRRILAVAAGAAALVLVLLVVGPQLAAADAQFAGLLDRLGRLLRLELRVDWLSLLLAVPVASYLFGHGYGAAHGRHTDHFTPDALAQAGRRCRVVPSVTIYIVLGGVCVVYGVFIGLQAQHLFSAFAGRLTGTAVYSQFAREGFFELCRVAAVNGLLLLAADLLAVRGRADSRALGWWNVALSLLTLLILASAASKMVLYIQAYGLTAKRVLTMAFMAMLAVLFGGTAVWQRRRFDVVRVSVVFAAALFCLLALCNLDGLIAAYNAAHGFG